jgi:hypothetical protein
MGPHIDRQYLSLVELIDPAQSVRLKLLSNSLEDRWRTSRGRAVNLDPGYVDLDKLVLLSTKNASHRVYVGQGIFAEATLHWVRGSFLPWPYTYPDYAGSEAIGFFNRVRGRYRLQRRQETRTRDPGDR